MDKQKDKPTTVDIAASEYIISELRRRLPRTRRMQSFLVVWLDDTSDAVKNETCISAISKLREVANHVVTFVDINECFDFIKNIKDEKAFLICSSAFAQTAVPMIHDMSQVHSVYISGSDETRYEQWAKEYPKIKSVFTDIPLICEALKPDIQQCDQNLVKMSFLEPSEQMATSSPDQLDQSFMYTQILKKILLNIDFGEKHIHEFITYCREQFVDSSVQLASIEKFHQEYHQHSPIWWYTYPGFLHSMLNRALRLMEVDQIISMGFFIRDLHQNIVALHTQQYDEYNHSTSFTIYRGQGLSPADFNQLIQKKGGLLSFNCFLSTSRSREVSFAYAESSSYNPDFIGVLFQITIDPSKNLTSFAKIASVSYFQTEDEILFSMHAIFRIGEIRSMDGNNRLCEVALTLTTDNDPELCMLTERLCEELQESTEWNQLGHLLINMGYFNQAEELYQILLNQTNTESDRGSFHYHLGCIKFGRGQYTDACISYEKALQIYDSCLSQNHLNLGKCYNDIALVYAALGANQKALSSHDMAVKIFQEAVSPNISLLATSYNNTAFLCHRMGEYSKALLFFEKAVEIKKKTLPLNHPSLAISYSNMSMAYIGKGEYSAALFWQKKALEIREKTLPLNHPNLAISYNNIGHVYHKMGEYSTALSFHEKALKIQQKALPPDHPDLANSYNNISLAYIEIGDYSTALSFQQKALEIRRKVLSANHPDLGTSYDNTGLVYGKMSEYSEALSFHEKALGIRQEALPPDHPDLADSYNNIGATCFSMGECAKALSFFERALDIRQRILPASHPNLQNTRHSIELVKENL